MPRDFEKLIKEDASRYPTVITKQTADAYAFVGNLSLQKIMQCI